ncbi:hypothetical protein PCE1_003441 [Barthelona sp. PCE]
MDISSGNHHIKEDAILPRINHSLLKQLLKSDDNVLDIKDCALSIYGHSSDASSLNTLILKLLTNNYTFDDIQNARFDLKLTRWSVKRALYKELDTVVLIYPGLLVLVFERVIKKIHFADLISISPDYQEQCITISTQIQNFRLVFPDIESLDTFNSLLSLLYTIYNRRDKQMFEYLNNLISFNVHCFRILNNQSVIGNQNLNQVYHDLKNNLLLQFNELCSLFTEKLLANQETHFEMTQFPSILEKVAEYFDLTKNDALNLLIFMLKQIKPFDHNTLQLQEPIWVNQLFTNYNELFNRRESRRSNISRLTQEILQRIMSKASTVTQWQLSLSHNSISNIGVLSSIDASYRAMVNEIDISANVITTVDFSVLDELFSDNLKIIKLNANRVSTIKNTKESSVAKNIETLELHSNFFNFDHLLSVLPHFTSLKHLTVAKNGLFTDAKWSKLINFRFRVIALLPFIETLDLSPIMVEERTVSSLLWGLGHNRRLFPVMVTFPFPHVMEPVLSLMSTRVCVDADSLIFNGCFTNLLYVSQYPLDLATLSDVTKLLICFVFNNTVSHNLLIGAMTQNCALLDELFETLLVVFLQNVKTHHEYLLFTINLLYFAVTTTTVFDQPVTVETKYTPNAKVFQLLSSALQHFDTINDVGGLSLLYCLDTFIRMNKIEQKAFSSEVSEYYTDCITDSIPEFLYYFYSKNTLMHTDFLTIIQRLIAVLEQCDLMNVSKNSILSVVAFEMLAYAKEKVLSQPNLDSVIEPNQLLTVLSVCDKNCDNFTALSNEMLDVILLLNKYVYNSRNDLVYNETDISFDTLYRALQRGLDREFDTEQVLSVANNIIFMDFVDPSFVYESTSVGLIAAYIKVLCSKPVLFREPILIFLENLLSSSIIDLERFLQFCHDDGHLVFNEFLKVLPDADVFIKLMKLITMLSPLKIAVNIFNDETCQLIYDEVTNPDMYCRGERDIIDVISAFSKLRTFSIPTQSTVVAFAKVVVGWMVEKKISETVVEDLKSLLVFFSFNDAVLPMSLETNLDTLIHHKTTTDLALVNKMVSLADAIKHTCSESIFSHFEKIRILDDVTDIEQYTVLVQRSVGVIDYSNANPFTLFTNASLLENWNEDLFKTIVSKCFTDFTLFSSYCSQCSSVIANVMQRLSVSRIVDLSQLWFNAKQAVEWSSNEVLSILFKEWFTSLNRLGELSTTRMMESVELYRGLFLSSSFVNDDVISFKDQPWLKATISSLLDLQADCEGEEQAAVFMFVVALSKAFGSLIPNIFYEELFNHETVSDQLLNIGAFAYIEEIMHSSSLLQPIFWDSCFVVMEAANRDQDSDYTAFMVESILQVGFQLLQLEICPVTERKDMLLELIRTFISISTLSTVVFLQSYLNQLISKFDDIFFSDREEVINLFIDLLFGEFKQHHGQIEKYIFNILTQIGGYNSRCVGSKLDKLCSLLKSDNCTEYTTEYIAVLFRNVVFNEAEKDSDFKTIVDQNEVVESLLKLDTNVFKKFKLINSFTTLIKRSTIFHKSIVERFYTILEKLDLLGNSSIILDTVINQVQSILLIANQSNLIEFKLDLTRDFSTLIQFILCSNATNYDLVYNLIDSVFENLSTAERSELFENLMVLLDSTTENSLNYPILVARMLLLDFNDGLYDELFKNNRFSTLGRLSFNNIEGFFVKIFDLSIIDQLKTDNPEFLLSVFGFLSDTLNTSLVELCLSVTDLFSISVLQEAIDLDLLIDLVCSTHGRSTFSLLLDLVNIIIIDNGLLEPTQARKLLKRLMSVKGKDVSAIGYVRIGNMISSCLLEIEIDDSTLSIVLNLFFKYCGNMDSIKMIEKVVQILDETDFDEFLDEYYKLPDFMYVIDFLNLLHGNSEDLIGTTLSVLLRLVKHECFKSNAQNLIGLDLLFNAALSKAIEIPTLVETSCEFALALIGYLDNLTEDTYSHLAQLREHVCTIDIVFDVFFALVHRHVPPSSSPMLKDFIIELFTANPHTFIEMLEKTDGKWVSWLISDAFTAMLSHVSDFSEVELATIIGMMKSNSLFPLDLHTEIFPSTAVSVVGSSCNLLEGELVSDSQLLFVLHYVKYSNTPLSKSFFNLLCLLISTTFSLECFTLLLSIVGEIPTHFFVGSSIHGIIALHNSNFTADTWKLLITLALEKFADDDLDALVDCIDDIETNELIISLDIRTDNQLIEDPLTYLDKYPELALDLAIKYKTPIVVEIIKEHQHILYYPEFVKKFAEILLFSVPALKEEGWEGIPECLKSLLSHDVGFKDELVHLLFSETDLDTCNVDEIVQLAVNCGIVSVRVVDTILSSDAVTHNVLEYAAQCATMDTILDMSRLVSGRPSDRFFTYLTENDDIESESAIDLLAFIFAELDPLRERAADVPHSIISELPVYQVNSVTAPTFSYVSLMLEVFERTEQKENEAQFITNLNDVGFVQALLAFDWVDELCNQALVMHQLVFVLQRFAFMFNSLGQFNDAYFSALAVGKLLPIVATAQAQLMTSSNLIFSPVIILDAQKAVHLDDSMVELYSAAITKALLTMKDVSLTDFMGEHGEDIISLCDFNVISTSFKQQELLQLFNSTFVFLKEHDEGEHLRHLRLLNSLFDIIDLDQIRAEFNINSVFVEFTEWLSRYSSTAALQLVFDLLIREGFVTFFTKKTLLALLEILKIKPFNCVIVGTATVFKWHFTHSSPDLSLIVSATEAILVACSGVTEFTRSFNIVFDFILLVVRNSVLTCEDMRSLRVLGGLVLKNFCASSLFLFIELLNTIFVKPNGDELKTTLKTAAFTNGIISTLDKTLSKTITLEDVAVSTVNMLCQLVNESILDHVQINSTLLRLFDTALSSNRVRFEFVDLFISLSDKKSNMCLVSALGEKSIIQLISFLQTHCSLRLLVLIRRIVSSNGDEYFLKNNGDKLLIRLFTNDDNRDEDVINAFVELFLLLLNRTDDEQTSESIKACLSNYFKKGIGSIVTARDSVAEKEVFIKNLQTDIHQKTESLSKKSETIERLEIENKELNDKLNSIGESNLIEENSHLKEQLEVLKTQRKDEEKKFLLMNDMIESIKGLHAKQVDSLTAEIDRLCDETEEQKSELKVLREEIQQEQSLWVKRSTMVSILTKFAKHSGLRLTSEDSVMIREYGNFVRKQQQNQKTAPKTEQPALNVPTQVKPRQSSPTMTRTPSMGMSGFFNTPSTSQISLSPPPIHQ